ncbi:MAG: acetyl-CoA carboxylase biotin carboxyl carrier protein, partial [Anaerovorax sp.]|nr:acetyl-CoA carboxylase biotin carboxyl carrier protein [Anaerovorax sp.]
MNIEEIKGLVRLLEESKLSCLEITEGSTKIRLEKNIASNAILTSSTLSSVQNEAQNVVSNITEPFVETKQEEANQAKTMSIGAPIKSPMVGVFYAAPSPDDVPYVAVGDSVKKGDVVCIVEAMKLLNEIVAECDGVISEICVKNGDVVEFGQP